MEPIESIYAKPEELLIEHVRNNDIRNIRTLVQRKPGLLGHKYEMPFDGKTIIQISCSTLSREVEPETIQTLIALGSDLSSKYIKKRVIHYAAMSLNSRLLATICSCLKQEGINDNATEYRDTALLCIIKECDCESKNALECIKVLLDHNADVNKANVYGESPILYAAWKGYRNVITLLLEYPNIDIDIDTHTIGDQTARDLIISYNLYNKKKLPPKRNIFRRLKGKKSRILKKRIVENSREFEEYGYRGVPSFNFEMEQIPESPESLLLKLVRKNEISGMNKLVQDNPGLLDHEYEKPFNGKTIIHIACSTLCAEVSKETVETLINLGADLFKHSKEHKGKRAIHFAATSLKDWLLNTICDHLPQEHIDDSTDNGDTALLCIIKECDCESKNALDCIRILLGRNADVNKANECGVSPIVHAAVHRYRRVIALLLECPNIIIDTNTYANRKALNFIFECKFFNTKKISFRVTIPEEEQLLLGEVLKTLEEGREDDFLKLEVTRDIADGIDSGETLLQICARNNLPRCARRLLDIGANVSRVTFTYPNDPLRIAAEMGHYEVFEVLCVNLEEGFQFLLQHKCSTSTAKINVEKCLELLLKNNETLANKKLHGETPLSRAIYSADKKIILILLNNGASLGDAKYDGRLPIDDIEIETLQKHFNNCICCSTDNVADKEFYVTFNYKTLLPTEFPTKSTNTTGHEGEAGPDSTLLYRDIRKSDSEMRVISYIAQSKQLRPLLTHPLITSLIHLKWHRIRYFFYANLVLYITTWLSLAIHTLMVYNDPDYGRKSDGLLILKCTILTIIWITFVFFIIKELFQLVVSPILYIKQIENLFEITFIISMGSILILPEPTDNSKNQISAIAILVSALQLVLLIGQLPKVSIYIIMLRTVCHSFFKLLLGNAVLILAFAISFCTLFGDNSTAFNGVGVSLFKTFVMMTGEFEVGDINFEKYPVISRTLFLVFIFMIVIVLFNLMNGLAVSDTQEIRNNAELFACKARVDHICYIKNMLLGNLAVMPSKLFKFCKLPGLNFKITLPRNVLKMVYLFPNYLQCFEVDVILNQKGRIRLPRSKEDVRLDEETLKNLRMLLKERNRLEEADDSLQKKLETVDDSIQKKLEIVDTSMQNKLRTVDNALRKKLETVDDSMQKKLEVVADTLQRRLDVMENQQKQMLDNINKILESLNRA